MKKIWIASDHAGYELKSKIVTQLKSFVSQKGEVEVQDMGPTNQTSVDYPDFADKVAREIHKDPNHSLGILICGSGQGMSMRANKYSNVRAALVWNEEVTQLARQHNDANVLCLGGRVVDHDLALKLVTLFLATDFEGGRHSHRVVKIGREILC